MTPAEIKAALAMEARTLGFDLCRVASAGVPPHAAEFREWLAEKNAAAAREAADDSAADHADAAGVPTFREWLAGQESRLTEKP